MGKDQENNIPEEQLRKEIEKLGKRNEKQEERIRKLQIKALQVANLYFVFQGVILFSVSSASSLKCHHWWLPFTLSLLAAVVNLYTVGSIVFAVLEAGQGLEQNLAELEFMKLQLNQVEPGTSLSGGSIRPRPDRSRTWKRRGFAYLEMVLLLGFSVIVLYSCSAILCHSAK